MEKDYRALLKDKAFLAKLAETAEYVGDSFAFETAFDLDQEILVSTENGWGGFTTALVTNFWSEGSSLGSMDQDEIDAMDEDERESLESEPARVMLLFPDARQEAYEYGDLEYYAFGPEELSSALGILLRETSHVPETDETVLITTSGDHGWAFYDHGALREGSRGKDPDWDEMLVRNGVDPGGQDYDEYQVELSWVDGLAGGFPPDLAGIPVEAYVV